MIRTPISILTLVVFHAGCVDPSPPGDLIPVVTTGDYLHLVQSSWRFPETSAEVQSLGEDLDGDGYVDNQAGAVISALLGVGLELELGAEEAFANGSLVTLHSVRADALRNDSSVSWRVFSGASTVPLSFDGNDQLTVNEELGYLVGEVRDGLLTAEHGEVLVHVPFFPDQPPIEIPLEHARITTLIANDGWARITGLIPAAALDAEIRPALAGQIALHVERHRGEEFAELSMDVFDLDDNDVLTASDVEGTFLFISLTAPDVDRDQDGEKDGLSLGLGFDYVSANYNEPAE